VKHIDYKTNPEVRLSSCTWYTPDFIIGNRLIVEVDGGIHDLDYRRTPDRMRHRALENMGYNVYRVRNKQVENSPFDVACMIVDRYYQIMEIESQGEGKDREKIPAPKIKKIYNPSRPEPLPEDLERLIPAWTIALHSKLTFENWTAHYFKQILSIYDSRLVTNQCAMERMILYLLGLNILGRGGDGNGGNGSCGTNGGTGGFALGSGSEANGADGGVDHGNVGDGGMALFGGTANGKSGTNSGNGGDGGLAIGPGSVANGENGHDGGLAVKISQNVKRPRNGKTRYN